MLILDLCGGTGSWSDPYKAAGYEVINVTLPAYDVRAYEPTQNVHGILAAPPCTEFAVAGARWWSKKDPNLLQEALDIVWSCIRIIETAKPKWWALENPAGRLHKFIGSPFYSWQPWEYGDPWIKHTCIWGRHIIPIKTPCSRPVPIDGKRWKLSPVNNLSPKPTKAQLDWLVAIGLLPPNWIDRIGPNPPRTTLRSITPPGFAKAFFLANP